MPDTDGAVDDAFGELLAAVVVDAGPVLTVALPATIGAAEAAGLAEACADRVGPTGTRFVFVGSDVVFAGFGLAVESRDVDAIPSMVAAARGRRCAVTVPFTASRSWSSSAWKTMRARVAWAPRVWLHHRDGRTVLGVDLGVDAPADRHAARALLTMLRRAPVVSPASPAAAHLYDKGCVPDEAGHRQAVHEALAAMGGETLRKVVVARRHRFHLDGAMADAGLALWRQATASSPDEVRYLCAEGGEAFVGVTPERLCRRRGRRLDVDVLAGSGPSGSDCLLEDDKERREHEVVRTFIVDALRPVVAAIEAPLVPRLRRLKDIQHLHTPITATLVDDAPVFVRLHPTPAVAGVPREEAVTVLGRLEGFDRGLYAGVIGIVDGDGEDLQVALRCAHLHGTGVVDLYAGSGLVPGSDPDREWQELERKERTMRTALSAVVGGDHA